MDQSNWNLDQPNWNYNYIYPSYETEVNRTVEEVVEEFDDKGNVVARRTTTTTTVTKYPYPQWIYPTAYSDTAIASSGINQESGAVG